MLIEQIYIRTRSKSKPQKQGESNYRSMVKALSWRILGTLDTILISWIISGNLNIAFSIGSIELITKTFIYYFHERLWNKIKWGK